MSSLVDATSPLGLAELYPRLLRTIRRQLDGRLAARIDPEDILQSALRSVIRWRSCDPSRNQDWDQLGGLIIVTALRKCAQRRVYHFAARRDVRREQTDTRIPDRGGSDLDRLECGPGPLAEALLTEATEQLWRSLDEREADVLARVLAGQGTQQIAHEMGRTQRTICRLLAGIRQRLELAART